MELMLKDKNLTLIRVIFFVTSFIYLFTIVISLLKPQSVTDPVEIRIIIGILLLLVPILSFFSEFICGKFSIFIYSGLVIVTAHTIWLVYGNGLRLEYIIPMLTVQWGGSILLKRISHVIFYNIVIYLSLVAVSLYIFPLELPLPELLLILSYPVLFSILFIFIKIKNEEELTASNEALYINNLRYKQTEEHLIKLNKDLYFANEKFRDSEDNLVRLNKELEEANRSIKESNNRFSTIFHSSPNAIILTSYPDGEYIDANLSFFATFLLSHDDVMNRKFNEMPIWYQSEDMSKVFQILQKNMRISNFEIMMKNKADEKIAVLITSEVIELNSQNCILCSIQDISDRKRAEEEILKAKESSDSANKLKTEFLANMSHEIRTPLHSVIGFSELLGNRIDDDTNKKYVEGIKTGGKNLLALINDILDLSKIEAGKFELIYNTINIRDFINEIFRLFIIKIEEKNLTFNINVNPNVPDELLLDEARLRQVLVNLVGNAVKFTETGSVTISISARQTDTDKAELIIEVADTGIGISKQDQGIVFEAFRQQSGQSTRQYGGTGLGLSITKRLVEMMGGAISVESEKGQGSRFIIVVPNVCIAGSYETDATEKQDYFDCSRIEFEPATVLVVDDLEMNRILLREYFKSTKISIAEASSGKDAVKYIAYSKPDLIILDLVMPGSDGFVTAKNIKSNIDNSQIPIIAMSSSSMKSEEERVYSSGFSGLLKKPISKPAVVKELIKHLKYRISSGDDVSDNIKSNGDLLFTYEEKKEISSLLNGELLTTINNLKKTLLIGSIKDFATRLRKLGEEYNLSALSNYSENLFKYCEKLDIVKIMEALDKYDDVVIAVDSLLGFK